MKELGVGVIAGVSLIAARRYVRPLTCEERMQYRIEPFCEAGQ
jgi:hypothetical protein